MRVTFAAALALTAAPSLHAQTAAPAPAVAPQYATPLPGTWSYVPGSNGSEARFLDSAARPQLIIHCTRATRRVRISKPASGAAPFLSIWTSSLNRNVPASFDPATGLISAELAAFDTLLDAVAFSRGRVAVSVTGSPQLVVPSWAEAVRVIEDCRV